MKGWVFINHSEAQTQRSPLCNTPSSGTPSAKPVLLLIQALRGHSSPQLSLFLLLMQASQRTLSPPQPSLFLLLQAPQRTLSMLHGSKPHSTLKDCQTVYWKGLLSPHPRKSSPPILSLGASHTHRGLSF